MKRTYAVNIAGYAFTIDENAYHLLNQYLDTIVNAFKDSDYGKEISEDIELRVAELLLEKTSVGSHIVSYEDVEQVITRIGKPEEIREEEIYIDSNETKDTDENIKINIEEETNDSTGPGVPPPYYPQPPKIGKKLYRDPDNALLGGVCSGLAWYLGMDVSLVRLFTVILVFLSASTVIIAYIIMWIVIPEARTPLQQMQMKGEEPTIENIGKNLTGNTGESSSAQQYSYNDTTKNVNRKGIFNSPSKILLICLGVICAPFIAIILFVLFVIVLAFIGAGREIIEGLPMNIGFYDIGSLESLKLWSIFLALGILLIIIIPLLIFVFPGKNKYRNQSKTIRIIFTAVWLGAIALFVVSTVKIVNNWKKLAKDHFFDYEKNITVEIKDEIINDSIPIISETETITENNSGQSVLTDSLSITEQTDSIAIN